MVGACEAGCAVCGFLEVRFERAREAELELWAAAALVSCPIAHRSGNRRAERQACRDHLRPGRCGEEFMTFATSYRPVRFIQLSAERLPRPAAPKGIAPRSMFLS